jgi:arylformamidase
MAGGPTPQDLLYNPRFTVPDYPDIARRWGLRSEQTRALERGYFDVPYGRDQSEKMDIFLAHGTSRALLMFIHGGYWRALDKKDFSFVAPALLRAGVTVALPNYALCPRVRVSDIVLQMVQACAWLHRNGANFGAPRAHLYACGHSAGGHLTAMMLACQWPRYAADLPPKVVHGGLAISGLYDLREIARTPSINIDIQLTEQDAVAVSPAFLPPATAAPLYIAVGEKETGGFHLQQALMRERWRAVLTEAILVPGRDHFSVLEELTRPSSTLFASLMNMMDAGAAG